MNMPVLRIHQLTKAFHGVPVLRSVDLELRSGEVLGVIGENGAGKSTLLNIVSGILNADAGWMELRGAPYAPRRAREAQLAGIGLVHQEQNLFGNLSIAENLYLNRLPCTGLWIRRQQMFRRAMEYLRLVGLEASPSTLVGRLSMGERQMVEMARVLASGANVLLLDEPTTSWSSRECEQFFALVRKLAAEGKAIVLVTHSIADVLAHCHRVAVLRDGAIVSDQATANTSPEQLVSLMVGRPVNEFFPTRSAAQQQPDAPIRLKVTGLSKANVVEQIDFEVKAGEILGVYGLMGAGRSELMRVLFGLDTADEGKVELNGVLLTGGPRQRIRQGVAFVTESRRRDGLCQQGTVAENMSLVAVPRFASRLIGWIGRKKLMSAIARMRSICQVQQKVQDHQPISTLSGGNQQKVILAKWLMADPQVLILDEPTRGIDVGSKFEIYRLIHQLADQGHSVLCVSSDLEELLGICDRLLVMSLGRITANLSKSQWDRDHILKAALSMHDRRSLPSTVTEGPR